MLLVMLGGGIGSGLRYALAAWVDQRHDTPFPLGILVVNALGSLVIGYLAGLLATETRWIAGQHTQFLFMTGLCGGFTTFSTFSLQTFALLRNAHWLHAGANILGSVLLCLVCVWLGHLLASALHR